jgi:hypothetical protein
MHHEQSITNVIKKILHLVFKKLALLPKTTPAIASAGV